MCFFYDIHGIGGYINNPDFNLTEISNVRLEDLFPANLDQWEDVTYSSLCSKKVPIWGKNHTKSEKKCIFLKKHFAIQKKSITFAPSKLK